MLPELSIDICDNYSLVFTFRILRHEFIGLQSVGLPFSEITTPNRLSLVFRRILRSRVTLQLNMEFLKHYKCTTVNGVALKKL
eukprot:gene8034-13948_t